MAGAPSRPPARFGVGLDSSDHSITFCFCDIAFDGFRLLSPCSTHPSQRHAHHRRPRLHSTPTEPKRKTTTPCRSRASSAVCCIRSAFVKSQSPYTAPTRTPRVYRTQSISTSVIICLYASFSSFAGLETRKISTLRFFVSWSGLVRCAGAWSQLRKFSGEENTQHF